ncbi:hypothetical protein Hanom_Chr14g01285691 [Helianthus anomalus]
MKPGPLSTMSTLEALGLDIQQWVISFFNGTRHTLTFTRHKFGRQLTSTNNFSKTRKADTNQETKHTR